MLASDELSSHQTLSKGKPHEKNRAAGAAILLDRVRKVFAPDGAVRAGDIPAFKTKEKTDGGPCKVPLQ
ncbi:hypothetical protein [Nitratireductor soli]|uniref:hypothetical protein n=1 Tax=Nitratireductor soli TaxID=1670619 RepID=UPI0012FA06B3|nr:hypothetical protein [Nitratireductor soli]